MSSGGPCEYIPAGLPNPPAPPGGYCSEIGTNEVIDQMIYPLEIFQSESTYLNTIMGYIGRMWCTLDEYEQWGFNPIDCVDCSQWAPDVGGLFWCSGPEFGGEDGCGNNMDNSECECLEPFNGCCPW